jgi:proteasome lid subunit RPN8/RPN11
MLLLPGKFHQAMIAHARTTFPNEACGILAGTEEKLEEIYRASNQEASPVHYLLDPTEQFRIFQEIEERGWRMRGIYHSHVKAAAFPSREDIEMAFYPDVLYLILSLRDWQHPELRGFWIQGGEVQEEGVEVLQDDT